MVVPQNGFHSNGKSPWKTDYLRGPLFQPPSGKSDYGMLVASLGNSSGYLMASFATFVTDMTDVQLDEMILDGNPQGVDDSLVQFSN